MECWSIIFLILFLSINSYLDHIRWVLIIVFLRFKLCLFDIMLDYDYYQNNKGSLTRIMFFFILHTTFVCELDFFLPSLLIFLHAQCLILRFLINRSGYLWKNRPIILTQSHILFWLEYNFLSWNHSLAKRKSRSDKRKMNFLGDKYKRVR